MNTPPIKSIRVQPEDMRAFVAEAGGATGLPGDRAAQLAGWLTEQFDCELWMSREEFLMCRAMASDTGREAPDVAIRFYRGAGYDEEQLERYRKKFGNFGRAISPLPDSFRRLVDQETITVGGRYWQVVVGAGHSPEHVTLYCPALKLLIAGDQLLPRISSNVSAHPTEPYANPLKDWLDSLSAMKNRLPEDVLVLPSHGSPFRGAHGRLDALIAEHMAGLEKLLEECREPRRAIDVFPALFKARISESNLGMATGESIAHLNYLLADGSITAEIDKEGVRWYQRSYTTV